jgi:hypothetical protein
MADKLIATMRRIKAILLSIRLFSALVVQTPLRAYQVGPADAVIDSCLNNRGLEFLWVFPRQSGKDEAVAQLCVFLLTLFQRVEAGIVHVFPTSAQLATGITRLSHRLENLWTGGRWWGKSKPSRVGLGFAQVAFFSGHPQARSEGATANLLLVVNEAQDQCEAVINRRYTPMRASTNATALYVGTVRTSGDFLWRKKTELEGLQTADGRRRVFMVSPDEVSAENPHYGAFVAEQVRLKGRNHPAIMTEYFNEPVDVAAGLFPERRRALMQGQQGRLKSPLPGEVYAALVDVGGQDEGATSPTLTPGPSPSEGEGELDNPARDYTVCTVVRVVRPGPEARTGGVSEIGPVYQAVDVFVDHGSRHFQEGTGKPSLYSRLLAYLRHWNVFAVVCDATGVGAGLADALRKGYKRQVVGFTFNGPNKARLGNDFLAVVETGRFQYWRDAPPQSPPSDGGETPTPALPRWAGEGEEGSDAWWFFEQCRACGYELRPGTPIERGLRWGVNETARVMLSNGRTELVHDDRLLSAALVAELDRMVREGELFVSVGESAVIHPHPNPLPGRERGEEGWY